MTEPAHAPAARAAREYEATHGTPHNPSTQRAPRFERDQDAARAGVLLRRHDNLCAALTWEVS